MRPPLGLVDARQPADLLEPLEQVRGARGPQGLNLVGADVVEVSSPYDHAEITGIAASHVAYDPVALLALRRQAETTIAPDPEGPTA